MSSKTSMSSKISRDEKFAHVYTISIRNNNVGIPLVDNGNLLTPKQLSWLTQWIRQAHPKPQRGDIVHLKEQIGYRNNGVYLYDGKSVIALDRDVDDYGALPPNFVVLDPKRGNFPIRYWSKTIDHNEYVWFDAPLKTLLYETFEFT
jgi:hypothetical protein